MSSFTFLLDAQKVGFFDGAFRKLWAWLCRGLYELVSGLLQTIFYLANFDILDLADEMMNRIYIIIGLFMLFKITISLLNYLVNPDKINDKETGASKMMARVVISLSMLILLPGAFSIMTDLQNQLLPVLPRIIIGKDTANSGTKSTDLAEATADNMVITIVRGFTYPAVTDQGECTNVININTLDDFTDNIVEKCDPYDDYYALSNHGIISFIVAALMVYVTFSLAIATSIRAFKLIILRAIAPAPVLSYIDPKSSKGDGMFSKWTKMFLSTWAELLVNLGIIYFIIFMIQKLFTNNNWQTYLKDAPGDGFIHGMVIAFIIIGLLMFAREAPKFIMDALGIKNAVGFGRMLGMGATALGGIGSGITGARASWTADTVNGNNHRNPLNWVKNGLAGGAAAIGGLSAGGHALMTDKDGRILSGFDAQGKYNSQVTNRGKNGITLGNRLGDFGSSLFAGTSDLGSNLDQEIAGYDSAFSAMKALTDTAEDKFKSGDMRLNYNGSEFSYKELQQHALSAQNGDEASSQWLADHGFSRTATRTVERDTVIGEDMWGNNIYGKETFEETYQEGDFTAALIALDDVAHRGASEMINAAARGDTESAFYDGTVAGKHSDATFAVKQAHFKEDIDLSTRAGAKKGQGIASNAAREVRQSERYLKHQKKKQS